MTTSQGAGTPAKQPADVAEASDGELSRQATPNAGTQEAAPLTGRVAEPPDDLRQLEAEIDRTRQQLGETVQELVARADVKSLARAKAAELRGRVKDTTSQARRTVTNGANGAKERWIPLTLAAGVLIAGCLALRQWRRSPGQSR